MVEIPHFVQTIAEKITKSFTQENEKNDPAKGKKIPFATTTYYN